MEDEKNYRVACTGFIAEGGLAYKQFLKGKNYVYGDKIRDILQYAITSESPVNPYEEERVTDVASGVQEATKAA